MAKITVLRPDEPAPPQPQVEHAPRRTVERPTIGLVDNGKPHARELLELLAEELHGRLGPGGVELLRKKSAAWTITPEQASDMAARAHIVVTGVGD